MKSTGMGIAARLLAAAALMSTGATSQAQGELDARPAIAAATRWLEGLDAGRYGASWEAAAPWLRESVARVPWETSLENVRGPLGVVISRKLREAAYSKGARADPAAELFTIRFDTRFTYRPLSTEIVTALLGADGTWRVSAYVLR